MLLIDGELQGKPADAEQARPRWRQMAGRDGVLLTGHAVRRVAGGRAAAPPRQPGPSVVRMGRPTDAELDAYIATGEPLAVAGALTIDGFGGWFVDGRRRRPVQRARHLAAADPAIAGRGRGDRHRPLAPRP